jgi:hypothetical protein
MGISLFVRSLSGAALPPGRSCLPIGCRFSLVIFKVRLLYPLQIA